MPRRRTSKTRVCETSAVVGVKALQVMFHIRHELVGDCTIDEAMVITEREVRHRPDSDRIVDDNRALLDRADTENRHLRLIDDRHAELRAKMAGVRNGER